MFVLEDGHPDDVRRFVEVDKLAEMWDRIKLSSHVRSVWKPWLRDKGIPYVGGQALDTNGVKRRQRANLLPSAVWALRILNMGRNQQPLPHLDQLLHPDEPADVAGVTRSC